MDELAFLPAHELALRIRRKQISALELLDLYLGRIARLGGPINAVTVLDAERARTRARDADAALARPGQRLVAPAVGPGRRAAGQDAAPMGSVLRAA